MLTVTVFSAAVAVAYEIYGRNITLNNGVSQIAVYPHVLHVSDC